MQSMKVGVFGATGYAGLELIRLLEMHPQVEIAFTTSESFAGQNLGQVYAGAGAYDLIASEEAALAEVEVVFLCLPHGASARTAVRALAAGCRVIDLSADFRLKDVATYERWYEVHHPAPKLLETAVYGLTEWARNELAGAELIACPGCYPTSILLPLLPLARAGGMAIGGTVIADAKSGVSGAGRTPKPLTHFVEVMDNLTPYSVGQSHRHWVEMGLVLEDVGGWTGGNLIFSPHLVAMPRGILSTIYVPLAEGWGETAVAETFAEAYGDESFIELLPAGQLATVAHVVRTNKCAIGWQMADAQTLIITSAIDNLTKGSAGQAVQNLNVMMGWPEVWGLKPLAQLPMVGAW